MKRSLLIVLTMVLIAGLALAETSAGFIPKMSMWGQSRADVKKQLSGDVKSLKINEKAALKLTNYRIANYNMDAYFIFDMSMQSYYGLSKVTYLLPGSQKYTSDLLNEVYNALVSYVTSSYGKPDSISKAKSTWETGVFKIEVGKGKFSNYTGYENTNVAIVVTWQNAQQQNTKPLQASPITTNPRTSNKSTLNTSNNNGAHNYILNLKTMKYHLPGCRDISKMNPENRKDVYQSEQSIIKAGYSRCGHCF